MCISGEIMCISFSFIFLLRGRPIKEKRMKTKPNSWDTAGQDKRRFNVPIGALSLCF